MAGGLRPKQTKRTITTEQSGTISTASTSVVGTTATENLNQQAEALISIQLRNEFGHLQGTRLVVPVGISTEQLQALAESILGHAEEDSTTRFAFFVQSERVEKTLRATLSDQQRRAWMDRRFAEGHRVLPNSSHPPFEPPLEDIVDVTCVPQAPFRIRPVTRSAGELPGHTEAILVVSFDPSSTLLATGSGDCSIKLWDVLTATPMETLRHHVDWIQALAWSPDGKWLASGSRDGTALAWKKLDQQENAESLKENTETETEDLTSAKRQRPSSPSSCRTTNTSSIFAKPRSLHRPRARQYISAIAWEPLHRRTHPHDVRAVSASRDGSCRLASLHSGSNAVRILSGHTGGVTAICWGGAGFIYSASQDRTIRVWDDATGSPLAVLEGHGGWVNCLALNTDAILRTGAWDHSERSFSSVKEAHVYARQRYETVTQRFRKHQSALETGERLVSCSDDHTLFLWDPSPALAAKGSSCNRTVITTQTIKPLARLTGHQNIVYSVRWSPDGRWIASASGDKSIRLWQMTETSSNKPSRDTNHSESQTLHSSPQQHQRACSIFRGHVGAVYHVSWSLDSRLVVSGSRDSTLKVWNVPQSKLQVELPGHADEVFATDWSPDGQRVASGGKDKVVRLWTH